MTKLKTADKPDSVVAKAEIEIQFRTRKNPNGEPVKIPTIELYERIAIHYRWNGKQLCDLCSGFHVSHIVTGRCIAEFRRLRDAKSFCVAVEKTDLLDFGKDVEPALYQARMEAITPIYYRYQPLTP